MLTRSAAQAIGIPAHDIFYVVRQAEMVTVSHDLPADSQELGHFESPCGAVEFAEHAVRERQARGEAVEFVDPPTGLVGAG